METVDKLKYDLAEAINRDYDEKMLNTIEFHILQLRADGFTSLQVSSTAWS